MNFLNDLWLRANNNPSCPYLTYSNIFLCTMRALAVCSRLCTHNNTLYTLVLLFVLLQVTLNTFKHISTCNETKEKKNSPCLAFLFLSISQFSSFFSPRIACLFLGHSSSTNLLTVSTCQRKNRHHDRWKCGKSFS